MPQGGSGLRSARRGEPTEAQSQAALVQWAQLASGTYPELRLLFAVPNGAYLGADRKTAAIVMSKLKAVGLKPGVPDLILPVARGAWHGLAIEMKRRGEKPTPEQDAWHVALTRQGWWCVVCYDCEQAMAVLLEYLGKGSFS